MGEKTEDLGIREENGRCEFGAVGEAADVARGGVGASSGAIVQEAADARTARTGMKASQSKTQVPLIPSTVRQ
jgi:hypothetical protein